MAQREEILDILAVPSQERLTAGSKVAPSSLVAIHGWASNL